MRYFEILSEDVVGKFAVVYHRTHTHENIEAIRAQGFQAGPRALYGRGIYTTYALVSQLGKYMVEQYGEFVIKSRVNLDGFLILEPDVARAVYGAKRAGLYDQINSRFNLRREFIDPYEIEELEREIEQGEFTSTIASKLIRRGLVQGARGLVYRGQRDGRCAVCFEADTVLPIAWTKISMADIETIKQHHMPGQAERELIAGLTWTKIVNRELVAKAMRPNLDRDLITQPEAIKTIPAPTPEQQMNAVTTDPTTIRFIRNPTPDVQLTAVMAKPDLIDEIANPSPEAIIPAFRIRLDNTKLAARLDPAVIIAALRMTATILPGVIRSNPDKKATAEQWDAAWHAPDAGEMIDILAPDNGNTVDAATIPEDALLTVLRNHPSALWRFSGISPQAVAAAVLSPNADFLNGYNVAIGNCLSHGKVVDLSAVPLAAQESLVRKLPRAVRVIKDVSTELVALAMTTDVDFARELDREYDLPPELKKLVKPGLRLFR